MVKSPEMLAEQYSAQKALCLKTRLSGSALRFASNLEEEIGTDFEVMLSSLQNRFSPPPNISLLTNQLASLEQGDSKVVDLEEKIETLVRKYAKADIQLSACTKDQRKAVLDNLKRQALHVSLNRDIFEELTRMNKVSSFAEMISVSKQIECNNEIIKTRKDKKGTRFTKILSTAVVDPRPAPYDFLK